MATNIIQLKEKGKPVYLKTHTAAIGGLESYIKKVGTDKAHQRITKEESLWTGVWYGEAVENGQVSSESPSQYEDGWILQRQGCTKEGALNGAYYHFSLVPKQYVQNPGSGGVILLLHGYCTNSIRKYLYIRDTKITRNDLDAPSSDTAGSGSKMFALSAVYEC